MQDIREKQRIQDLSNIDLSYDLYSFDIFDTLVTRRVATPSGIFAIMQDMIQETSLPKLIKANFFDIRINSEEIARSNHCCFYQSREVCFEDIYKTMQKNYSLSDSEISFLMNTEINTEINNITGIAENINKLKYLISNNKRVILVSDMYFNTVILKKILVGIDPVFTHIKVYVSNEFQASKANGNLYEVIKNIEDISYQQWLHIGDNFHSDIKKRGGRRAKTSACQADPRYHMVQFHIFCHLSHTFPPGRKRTRPFASLSLCPPADPEFPLPESHLSDFRKNPNSNDLLHAPTDPTSLLSPLRHP